MAAGAAVSMVGIDACPRGWIAVVTRPDAAATGHFLRRLDDLLDAVPDGEAVAIDIPIGLPHRGRRRADEEVRRRLGPRRSSVFSTPVAEALAAPTHAEASAVSRRLTGHGISRQAYALAPRIFEAEQWSASVSIPVWEVHPELSFAVMMGHPAHAPKSTWAGVVERWRALAAAGIRLGEQLDEAGRAAGPDDVLDAAAAAWSAARLHAGRAFSVPDPPEPAPASGRPMAIWV